MAATSNLFCLLFGFILLTGAPGLKINVTNEGDYTISHDDGTVWLRSAPTFFVINSVTYSSADKTLTLLGVNETGMFGREEYFLYYQANETVIVASIHRTASFGAVVGFSVTFPNGANGTKAATPDDVTCGFPGFKIDEAPARLAYLSYGLSTFEAAVGRWQNNAVLLYGGRTGSGPFALFDNQSLAIVMGSSSSFTVTSLWHDVSGSNIYWGIMGGVTEVPVGFQYGVSMIGNDNGVKNGIGEWAMVVRAKMGVSAKGKEVRTQAIPVPGNLLGTLGYWTSPGSAYYAGPASGTTYEDTLYSVRHYSFDNDTEREPRVEFVHVEVDDWWYVKGQHGGVKTWTAPLSIFPDGITGLANKTQWLVAAACGLWDQDNTFDQRNGGQFHFVSGHQCALPQDQNFWNFLFANTVRDKLRVFVQKDMDAQYDCMTSNDSDVTTIMTWLSQLSVSATEHDMEVLFSRALPRLAMEVAFSHTLSPVIQVGASSETKDANHWKVGVANIFVDALGLRPFFGVFKSDLNHSEIIPHTQLSPELYSLLATLTGGPVAVGDEIGGSNKMLIDKCCSADGRVLGPLRPAKAIDAQFQQMAWGGDAGATGEVYTTFTGNTLNSKTDNNFFTGIVLAVGMTRPFSITPKSAGFNFVAADMNVPLYTPRKIFAWHNPYLLHNFTETEPFTLDSCTADKYCLYFAAPVVTFKGKEVVIMGDFFKWVPLSSQRIDRIEMSDSSIDIYVRGVPGERVYMYLNVGGRMRSLEERIGPTGDALVRYEEGGVLPSAAGRLSRWSVLGVTWFLLAAFALK